MANPGDPLPPEGREEAKKNKGAPADPTPVEEHEAKPVWRTGPDDSPAQEPPDYPSKYKREGYKRAGEREQEAALERHSFEKPTPDFMPDADPQDRQAMWEGLTPEQKDAIRSVSAAPAPLPGEPREGGYQRSKGHGPEITGGGRQPDPGRKTKEGKYIYGETAPMERSPDFYTEMDALRIAAQNEE